MPGFHRGCSSEAAKLILSRLSGGDLNTLFTRSRLKTRFDQYFQRLCNNESVGPIDGMISEVLQTGASLDAESNLLFMRSVVESFFSILKQSCRTTYASYVES